MPTAYCFFSFDLDQPCLEQAIRSIRAFDPSGRIAVFDDGNAPMKHPPRVHHYEVTHFERRWNLNGRECIMAEIMAFMKAARLFGADFVAKMDSDTVLLDPDKARHMMQDGRLDLCGSTWEGSETAWGPFYLLRTSILHRMMEAVSSIGELSDEEDKGMTAVCRHAGGRVKLVDFKEPEERWLNGLDYRLQEIDPANFIPADPERFHSRRVAVTCGNRASLSGPDPRAVCARAQAALLDLTLKDRPFDWATVMAGHSLSPVLPEVPASLGETDEFDETWAERVKR